MAGFVEIGYYPFGMQMPGRSYTAVNSYRYGFNGKEKDNSTGNDNYDFGERIYDGRVGRWLSTDPLQSRYPNLSPYNFVANSPLSCIDPDGRLIIFINGLRFDEGAIDQGKKSPHMFGHGPARRGIYHRDKILQDYWRTDKNSFGRGPIDIAEGFKKLIGDDKDYYISGSSHWQSKAKQRVGEGKAKAELFHAMVQSGQIKIDEGETIKIVSHSHGGAHSAGFAEQLMSYKDADGKPLYNIEVMYYITPHQPTKFSHPAGVKGVQYSHPSDAISSADPYMLPNGGSKFGPIPGITHMDRRDIMNDPEVTGYEEPRPGQIPSTGANGNRGGHNVWDNDFILNMPRLDPGSVKRRLDNPGTPGINPNGDKKKSGGQ